MRGRMNNEQFLHAVGTVSDNTGITFLTEHDEKNGRIQATAQTEGFHFGISFFADSGLAVAKCRNSEDKDVWELRTQDNDILLDCCTDRLPGFIMEFDREPETEMEL
jgi:hypothetical protein